MFSQRFLRIFVGCFTLVIKCVIQLNETAVMSQLELKFHIEKQNEFVTKTFLLTISIFFCNLSPPIYYSKATEAQEVDSLIHLSVYAITYDAS